MAQRHWQIIFTWECDKRRLTRNTRDSRACGSSATSCVLSGQFTYASPPTACEHEQPSTPAVFSDWEKQVAGKVCEYKEPQLITSSRESKISERTELWPVNWIKIMDALKSAGRAIIRSPSLAKQSWSYGKHKSKFRSFEMTQSLSLAWSRYCHHC